MTAPSAWTMLIVFISVGTVIATMLGYEALLREARQQVARARLERDQAQYLLTAIRHLTVIKGGAK